MQSYEQNNIFGESFLSSKWLNPDYLFTEMVAFFNGLSNFTLDFRIGPNALSLFHGILWFLALFFLTLIFYCAVRLFEIRKKEHHHLHHEIAEYAHHQKELEKKAQAQVEISRNPRWSKTLQYLLSEHTSDWKLAVIEADSMLEELLSQIGFKGETLGDRLKSATQDKFKNLSVAWEVHTIRNRIAHEGINFELSNREAKRVIAIYEQIFKEYGFI